MQRGEGQKKIMRVLKISFRSQEEIETSIVSPDILIADNFGNMMKSHLTKSKKIELLYTSYTVCCLISTAGHHSGNSQPRQSDEFAIVKRARSRHKEVERAFLDRRGRDIRSISNFFVSTQSLNMEEGCRA